MKLKEKIKEKFGNNPLFNAFTESYGFRTLITTIGSAFITVVFAVFNGVTAVNNASLWYGAFAGYYVILALQRISPLLAYRGLNKKYKDDPNGLYRAKLTMYIANGAVFVPMDIALATVAGMMVLYGKPTSTGEIMAIISATYAFYKITMSIVNLTKAKKENDPLIQSLRNIGFVDALVSMLVLETTLISTFGVVEGKMLQMVAWSGMAICTFLLGFAIFMIIRGARKLKKMKEVNNEQ